MPDQLIRNKETGAFALWDGAQMKPIEGEVAKSSLGNYAIWDKNTATLMPVDLAGNAGVRQALNGPLPAPLAAGTAKPPDQLGWGGIILDAVKKGALPTLGGIGGGIAGGLAATPTVAGVPAGVLAGEMAGAAGGELLNQQLGITAKNPDNTFNKNQIALSGAAGPIGRAGAWAAKGLLSTVVKGFGGRELISDAANSVLTKWLSPKVSSAQLYKDADALGVLVPATKTAGTIGDILNAESRRAGTSVQKSILDAMEPLAKFFPNPAGGSRAMAVSDLMEESQRLRYLASNAESTGNSKLSLAINKVRASMLNDLEDNGAGVVKEASRAYRKEMAIEDLGKILSKPNPLTKFRDFATDHPLFAGAFDDQEKAQITRIIKKIAYVPPSGGSGLLGRAVTGTAGAAMAGPAGAFAGVFGPDALRGVLGTKFGRNFTEKLLAGKSGLDAPTAAALAIFARGMMAPDAPRDEPQTPAGFPAPFPQ